MSALAMFVMNVMSKLGGFFYDSTKWTDPGGYNAQGWGWLEPIVKVIDSAFWPVMIILASAGSIWIIILAVNLAKAETADKATEAKKRLINVVIALASIIVLIILLSFFIKYMPTIFKSASDQLIPETVTP